MKQKVLEIPIEEVKPDPFQPRGIVTEESVQELAQNMKANGQIHPIVIDTSNTIIVGERRWLAAKLNGDSTIKAIVEKKELSPFQRYMMQVSENYHRSGAEGEELAPIDKARSYATMLFLKVLDKRDHYLKPDQHRSPGERSRVETLYELSQKDRTAVMDFFSKLDPNELYGFYADLPNNIRYGLMQEIVEEAAFNKTTVFEVISLLKEPHFVLKAVEQGVPRTYIREAERAPEGVKDQIKQKLASGGYKSREEIIKDVEMARKFTPEEAAVQLARKRDKENAKDNRILNKIVELALALKDQPRDKVLPVDQTVIDNQLAWLQTKIDGWLEGEMIKGEELETPLDN